ncbi:hypothetical protein MAPG_06964 [Magnaporthiopsis poae ATCC 64411]|uniref:Uncharacterized protein n=1 Tax=Magnaporthiopsis poae (strain ATCC 64411 / 73-15) TaxID=644358 RepID=A0A0C4E3G5_MAGP6|nr:hypothetical protein MAPG_06964 [Magnaporthiopsis poae ATCC 64411]
MRALGDAEGVGLERGLATTVRKALWFWTTERNLMSRPQSWDSRTAKVGPWVPMTLQSSMIIHKKGRKERQKTNSRGEWCKSVLVVLVGWKLNPSKNGIAAFAFTPHASTPPVRSRVEKALRELGAEQLRYTSRGHVEVVGPARPGTPGDSDVEEELPVAEPGRLDTGGACAYGTDVNTIFFFFFFHPSVHVRVSRRRKIHEQLDFNKGGINQGFQIPRDRYYLADAGFGSRPGSSCPSPGPGIIRRIEGKRRCRQLTAKNCSTCAIHTR